MYTKDSFKGADALTEDIRLKLEKLIIAINDQHVDELITNIEMLYKQKISTEIGISTKDKEAEFELMKNMVAMVNHYVENDPVRVEKMRSRITEYLYNLNQLGLNDEDLEQNKQNKSLVGGSVKSFFTIILGFPVYIYGLINNYLPFEIPGLLANKITKVIEYKGAIGMVLGMFTFFIFYTLQILFVWKFTHQFWILLIYAISLPLTGMFTYWYFHTVEEIRAKWILMKVFYKKSTLISGLITERQHIILEFDKARDEYLKQ
jgi:hypothetical protein